MATPTSPFIDHAYPVLKDAPIPDEQKADLYDIFHNSKDPNELAQHLAPLSVPDAVKANLHIAKQRSQAGSSAAAKAAEALQELTKLDPNVLQIAENHPKMAQAFIAAATKEASDAAASEGKGKTSKNSEAPAGPPVAELPPRPDGEPHMPPIPENHFRVLASDGGVHDIPQEHIDQARQIDPLLHVMNPVA